MKSDRVLINSEYIDLYKEEVLQRLCNFEQEPNKRYGIVEDSIIASTKYVEGAGIYTFFVEAAKINPDWYNLQATGDRAKEYVNSQIQIMIILLNRDSNFKKIYDSGFEWQEQH